MFRIGDPKGNLHLCHWEGLHIADEDEKGVETNVLLLLEVVNSAIAQYFKGVFEAEGATSE